VVLRTRAAAQRLLRQQLGEGSLVAQLLTRTTGGRGGRRPVTIFDASALLVFLQDEVGADVWRPGTACRWRTGSAWRPGGSPRARLQLVHRIPAQGPAVVDGDGAASAALTVEDVQSLLA
jgi:hypothetical protein